MPSDGDQTRTDAKIVRDALGLLAQEAEASGRAETAARLHELSLAPAAVLARFRRLVK